MLFQGGDGGGDGGAYGSLWVAGDGGIGLRLTKRRCFTPGYGDTP
jgi:hypothetical protein